MQQAFVEEFGALLEVAFHAGGGRTAPGASGSGSAGTRRGPLGRCPLLAPGSVAPTPRQRAVALVSVAQETSGRER